jgi:hypothetical protein
MRGVDRHVEWGRRQEPLLHARRSGGGRVKRKWSTVKLHKIVQQDGELLMRQAGQTQSVEDDQKVIPRSVVGFTPNPEVKRKAFSSFDMYRSLEIVPEQASIRNKHEDRRLHDRVVD